MGIEFSHASYASPIDIETLAASIARTQLPTGEIPWHEGGKTDPWDHVESAMGLAIAGYTAEARKAYEWLADIQQSDGGWYSAYREGVPEDRTKESNMSSYLAVGIFHYYLITRDHDFLKAFWPAVSAGIDFALGMQGPGGEIYWARNAKGEIDPMALLTGSSSIFLSLRCGLAMAALLGKRMPAWEKGLVRLRDAIRFRPHLFNKEKTRFSMDWYYPILCGAITGLEAFKRLEKSWDKFIVPGLGVRCVSDRPWVTMAETSEFILALIAMGRRELASKIFSWIQDKRFDDGTYWCGVTFPDNVIWPEEKISWTNGVVIMAADALHHLTAASQLFNHAFWEDTRSAYIHYPSLRGHLMASDALDEHAAEMGG
ncbi:MAG: phenyltransferase domain-containing protein [Syntrophaceae bacterium]